jgi:NAD(P)-dependent dehydrogenase (short-subunit alcohol dehydrogenase family)
VEKKRINPPQEQDRQPGHQHEMSPAPITIRDDYVGSGRLAGKVALITGGDSGIGRAIAVHFAREGADIAFAYLDEDEDADETRDLVERERRRCFAMRGDLRAPQQCKATIAGTIAEFGKLDILVNNHAEQHVLDPPETMTAANIRQTFETNVFSYFHLIDNALPYLTETKGTIINTVSVVAARGHDTLLAYAATKGAVQALTFSLAKALAERGIRVNGVSPGPIWTPLIPASFDADTVAEFGSDTLMQRAGQPSEVAPAYVFLACADASYVTGQLIHVNGGGHIAA